MKTNNQQQEKDGEAVANDRINSCNSIINKDHDVETIIDEGMIIIISINFTVTIIIIDITITIIIIDITIIIDIIIIVIVFLSDKICFSFLMMMMMRV